MRKFATNTIDMIQETDRIKEVNIEEEMKSSYIDYSMSVIVSRALPDVRDGFKPVHRRILYGMMDMGITHDKATKKSAAIVGEVLGNTTLTEIVLYMVLWCVWLSLGRCVIR